ncbi:hypothetical protein AV955_gp011 [Diadromus pulchellus ascovirus 4a]|uniref:Complete DpAV4 genome n=1 Tax=Diadromus pulchellus ascovirus 4a TaxID=158683 RepID=F2NYU0_9VIRU|nr:hypothetical protein AV955_gp011 [Diadromus pulchellus ascovirus 4a]CCA61368.1 unnamed protein product [Diadromus pulchellus ascovirus 4a]
MSIETVFSICEMRQEVISYLSLSDLHNLNASLGGRLDFEMDARFASSSLSDQVEFLDQYTSFVFRRYGVMFLGKLSREMSDDEWMECQRDSAVRWFGNIEEKRCYDTLKRTLSLKFCRDMLSRVPARVFKTRCFVADRGFWRKHNRYVYRQIII